MGLNPFGLFEAIFPIFFTLFLGVFIYTLFKNMSQWNKNNNSPIATVNARVMGKRTETQTHPHTHDNVTHHQTSTTYFITFELANGERLEFKVRGRDYGMMAEGDNGILTYQGNRFKHFERQVGEYEKERL